MTELGKRLLIAGMVLLPWGGITGEADRMDWAGAAKAQDDDGGGGGDDDDDDGPAPRSNNGDDDHNAPAPRQVAPATITPRRVAPPVAPPVVATPLPTQAPDEIVALSLTPADLALLLDQGFELIEERPIPGFTAIARRLRVPEGLALTAGRDLVRAVDSGQDADFNHYYRLEQQVTPASAPGGLQPTAPCDGLHCPAFTQVGWQVPANRALTCGTPVIVGMIDTGLNPDHATFAGAQIEVLRMSDTTQDPSRAVHGTAVAALLVGDPASRSPGLIPHVQLVAIDAFYRDGGDERAEVFALADALGQLADRQVRVINLSLAGPPNTVLEEVITRLIRDNAIIVVAAAGNDGPAAPPVYPAAYAGVIAVTAVDADGDIYRRAGQGDHVALSAPGVAVWTAASVSGARDKTGTSFAAPFVTAAAALLLQAEPNLSPPDVAARLAARATDLGPPGRDPVFGHGVVIFAGLCPGGL